jgi:metal-sulfur cluster biosynthetic enzyme
VTPGRAAAERPRCADLGEADVIAALGGVVDPELDESIVELGFVRGVHVTAAHADAETAGEPRARVRVELRLPTYWCAPNFSWLMAEDVREALLRDPRVAEVEVALTDHHAAAEISSGVSSGRVFQDVFGGAPDGRLVTLRALFRRKAFLTRQEHALKPLTGTADKLARLRIADLPDTESVRAYLAVRAELGLDCSPRAPALTDAAGRPVSADRAVAHLRRARLMRVSTEGNAAFCRGLLATRYGEGSR